MSLDLGSAMGRIVLDAQDALDATDKVGRGLSGLAGPAGAMGAAVASAAAVGVGALVALGASSVGVAREFESSMAIMSTAVDPLSVGVETTAEAMGIMSDAALTVGADTALVGVSATSAAEAMTGLYKAGLSTGEIFGDLQGYLAGTAELGGALRASVDLAAASELDMVQASELAAVTLATFGSELTTEAERAEFINSAMNNFVQTADASVASVGDLQAAFINVAPAMAQFGIPMEDVNTALGILSSRGITGAEAGTNLKSMMLHLMNGTKPVTEAMNELGISLYDAEGNMYTLPQIMSQVEQSLAGLTEEQQNHYIKTLAGNYGISSMTALLGEGSQGWIDMERAIGDAATIQEVAAARANTLAGAQEALSGVMETFKIKIGTALIPVLTALADIGATLLEKYGPMMTAMFEAVGNGIGRIIEVISGGQLGELFTVFEDGSSVLGSIFEAFGMGEAAATRLATGISTVVTTVQNALAPIVAAVTQFVSWKDVLIALGLAVTAAVIPAIVGIVTAVAPIALVIGGIIAVIALFRTAWEQNWGGIQEKVAAVIGFIGPLIQTALTTIQTWWATNGAAILAKAQEIFGGIQTIIQTVIGAAIAWWNTNWPTIQQTIQTVWGLIQTVIGAAVQAIRPAIETIMTTVQGAGEKLQGLAGPLQELWAKVGPFIQAAATIIGAILTALVGFIVGIVNGIAAALQPFIETFVNVAENIIRIVGGIIGFLTGFFNIIIGLFTGNGEKIKEAWSQMGEGIKDIVGGLVTGVWELFSGLVETVATLIDGFITGIIEFFQNLYDEIVGNSIIPDLVEAIVDWFENLITWIGDALKKLWAAVSEPFIQMWQNLTAWFGARVADAAQLGRNIVQGIVNGINSVGQSILNAIGDWVQAAIDWAKALLGISSPSTIFYDIGVNIGQGLVNGILATAEDVASAMDSIFKMMGNVSGIAGGFGSQFQRQILDPLQDGVAAMGKQLGDWDDTMSAIAQQIGYDARFPFNPGAESELLRLINYEHASPQQRDQARVLLSMMRERNQLQVDYLELQQELAAEERRLAALQEKQNQNAFLQEQLKLIQLIRDNNLSADILSGLTLGLGADAGALMDAMRHALEQMIQAAEQQLGIASPSAVFKQIGQQINRGLLIGLADNRGVINAMREAMDDIAVRATVASFPALAAGGRTAHLYGGQHFYIQQPRRSVLEDIQTLLAP